MRRGITACLIAGVAAAVSVTGLSWPVMAAPAPVSPSALVIPPDGDREVGIPLCRISKDRDCIQSVSIIRDGKRVDANLTSASGDEPTLWTYPDSEGRDVTFVVEARLKPTGVVESWGGRVPGARFWVSRQADRDNPFRGDGDLECDSGDRAACTFGSPPLPDGDSVEIAFRSSWIRPLNVAVRGRDFAYRTSRIPGGTLFVMAASQDVLPRVSTPGGTPIDEWQADAWVAELNFIIDHAGDSASESAYDPRCARFGAPIAGHNAPAAGRPSWDNGANSLNFAIHAPHHGPDGKVFRGFFQAQIPIAWLKCESGRKDLRASGFSVRVVAEDGEEQVATTALAVRKGTLHVQAFGFHYSSPTVQIVSKKRKR